MKLPFVLLLGCLCGLIACGGNSETGTNQPPVPSASMAITSTAPPSGAAGLPYGGTGFLLSAAGGMAPYRWQWAAASTSSLPQGMSISTEGLLSGTPTLPGTYTVVVTVVDAESPAVQVSARYTISISGPPALAITSGTPPSGTMGVEYGPERIENFSCVWSPILGWHLACVPCSAASCAALPDLFTAALLAYKTRFPRLYLRSRGRANALHLDGYRLAGSTQFRCQHRRAKGHTQRGRKLPRDHHRDRFSSNAGPSQRRLCDRHCRAAGRRSLEETDSIPERT
jgi:Putative Ig domain